MSDAIAPIVGDTDDPSSRGNGNGVVESPPPPVPQARRAAGTKPSLLSSRLDHLKISTIRQHYYPEGGWGWVICACGFVVNALTTGLLLSYGVLKREVIREFGEEYEDQAEWLGSLSVSLGLFLSPLIVAFCRRKSTRLTAVFGGLTAALGCLFTSFASQMHQVFLSYGFVMALGLSLARVTSSLMIGQYFKRRREKVEIIVTSGTGCGVIVFSYSFANIIRALQWRIGLHAVTGLAAVPFFVGICYRSASLYHPQRRAILHLKNQRKKIKDKSGLSGKPPFFDLAPLRSGALLSCMLAAALASFPLYAPFFHMASLATAEGLDEASLLQLQAHLGLAFIGGCGMFGLLLVRKSADCIVGRAYLCQGALLGLALACLALQAAQGFRALLLFCWMFGVPCGGLHYCLKMLVFEKVRAKSFGRAWAYVEMAQSVPVLVGVPVIGYINASSPRTGYYFAAGCFVAAAAALLLTRLSTSHPLGRRRGQGSCSTCTSQTPSCCCTQEFNLMQSQQGSSSGGGHPKCQKTISFSDTVDVADDDDDNHSPRRHPLPPPPPDDDDEHWRPADEDEEENVDFDNIDLDDNVVVCYDNGRPSGVVVVEEQRKTIHRYGCGHVEEELMDVFRQQFPPAAKRQMTIIEEVTSSV